MFVPASPSDYGDDGGPWCPSCGCWLEDSDALLCEECAGYEPDEDAARVEHCREEAAGEAKREMEESDGSDEG